MFLLQLQYTKYCRIDLLHQPAVLLRLRRHQFDQAVHTGSGFLRCEFHRHQYDIHACPHGKLHGILRTKMIPNGIHIHRIRYHYALIAHITPQDIRNDRPGQGSRKRDDPSVLLGDIGLLFDLRILDMRRHDHLGSAVHQV